MSWNAFITDLEGKGLRQAIIACRQTGNIWAKSDALQQGDVQTFMANYDNENLLAASGIQLGQTKYMYLSSNDNIRRFKSSKAGVHTAKSNLGKFRIEIYLNGFFKKI